jgi:hypothetical protein
MHVRLSVCGAVFGNDGRPQAVSSSLACVAASPTISPAPLGHGSQSPPSAPCGLSKELDAIPAGLTCATEAAQRGQPEC